MSPTILPLSDTNFWLCPEISDTRDLNASLMTMSSVSFGPAVVLGRAGVNVVVCASPDNESVGARIGDVNGPAPALH